MKNKLAALMLGACILQTFALAAPAFAGSYHAARREEAKASHSRAAARQDRREGHNFRAKLHEHHARHEAKRAYKHRHGY